jgi:hypothetical protein
MEKIKARFAGLLKVTKDVDPELHGMLAKYRPDSWVDREGARRLYTEIAEEAKSGKQTSESRWDSPNCSFEVTKTWDGYSHRATRKTPLTVCKIVCNNYGVRSTFLLVDFTSIEFWVSGEIRICPTNGESEIKYNDSGLHFKAIIGREDYKVNVNRNKEVTITKKMVLRFFIIENQDPIGVVNV